MDWPLEPEKDEATKDWSSPENSNGEPESEAIDEGTSKIWKDDKNKWIILFAFYDMSVQILVILFYFE